MRVPLPDWIAPSGHGGLCECMTCADLRAKLQAYADGLKQIEETKTEGPPYIWAGQCLKCGDCFEKETPDNKPPFQSEDGKSIGVLCPSCRNRSLKMVGVVHFSQRIEDFVPEQVHSEWR